MSEAGIIIRDLLISVCHWLTKLQFSWLQISIHAPLLFSLYMLPLSQIMRKNQIAYHSYADDTQFYLALSPNDYSPIDSLCLDLNPW